MADLQVKAEIKGDDDADHKNLDDIQAYEDDHDLKFPDDPDQQAWLVKLPRDMWQAWSELYAAQAEGQAVEIGKMRVYNVKPGETGDPKVEVRLDPALRPHADIPKNYTLEVKARSYNNTVVFSEKDLPGHRRRGYQRNRAFGPRAGGGLPYKNDRYGGGGAGDTGSKSGYRSAIPKQTTLAPIINNEGNAVPVEDDEYFAYLAKKWEQSANPTAKVTYSEGVDRAMHPGASSRLATFSTTSRVGGAGAMGGLGSKGGKKKKGSAEKAVRMERNALMDALYGCFRRYRYWSLKALRNELKQPETYIKETLDDVAILVKSGDFANTWQLKPQYEQALQQEGDMDTIKDEAPADDADTGSDGSGDDMGDDEDEFEDVKMEDGS